MTNDCTLTVFEPCRLMDTLEDGKHLSGGLLQRLHNFSYILQVKKMHVF